MKPRTTSGRASAARRNDVALGFEGGNRSDATVARRGASAWRVTATGRQAHSAGGFGQEAGFGAIYELARIVDAFHALGWGEVAALDPGRRGAGDISFVTPIIDGLDGLGALGGGSHAPEERVSLPALQMQTERAALLIHRLGAQPAASLKRAPSME